MVGEGGGGRVGFLGASPDGGNILSTQVSYDYCGWTKEDILVGIVCTEEGRNKI